MVSALLLGAAALAVAGSKPKKLKLNLLPAYVLIPPKTADSETITATQEIPIHWLLGEGPPQANQWLQLAETAIKATSTALAPVVGPIAKTAIDTVAGIIGAIKTKDRWVTPAVPGSWWSVALINGTPPLDCKLSWGRARWGWSGVRRWATTTGRKTSGALPFVSGVPLPQSGDPAWRYIYDGTSKSTAKHTKWIQPPGPPMPAAYVAVAGGQTEVVLWLPARGGDAKDGPLVWRADVTVS